MYFRTFFFFVTAFVSLKVAKSGYTTTTKAIRIHLRDLDDGEHFPTKDEFTPLADVEVTQGDWNGYKNVFMYTTRLCQQKKQKPQ